MQCFGSVYDISVLLGEENITFPGDVPYSRETAFSITAGDYCNLSNLILCAHSGTHIDAPAHFIEGAKTIEEFPVERFILPCCVVNIEGEGPVKSEDLKGIDIHKGHALLFRTQNSLCGLSRGGTFSETHVYLSEDAAAFCVELGVSLVGIDYISVDKYGEDSPIHRMLLDNDVLILEGIDLKPIPAGRYMLIALPLRIKGAEGAPARAILLR
jgi:arylformamidase